MRNALRVSTGRYRCGPSNWPVLSLAERKTGDGGGGDFIVI